MTQPVAPVSPPLCAALAQELRVARVDVVQRWLERISARVTIDTNKVFPTEALLNHVPILVEGIADYLEAGAPAAGGHLPVEAKAMELGALRHEQGFDAYEILKEHEMLSGILYAFLFDALARAQPPVPAPQDVALCWQRVAEATEMIRQATMTHFLRISGEQVRLREERLRRFNRMVTHELKNSVGAIRGAGQILVLGLHDPMSREPLLAVIERNGEILERVLDNLIALSHLESDARQKRNVPLPQAAAEVARQLRDAAAMAGVTIRVGDDIPSVEVDAAAVEVCLANYVSNAIKYADAAKQERVVDIIAELDVPTDRHDGELVIKVRDNGIGVPREKRDRLFEQFYRAHTDTVTADGTGLGLSIVQETVSSLGGRAWAEFPKDGGSVFAFSLPSRRAEDAAAAGTRRPESTTVVVETRG
ncbi:MAG TPA: HAMP domain-containing sensor histidine kinase [Gemmatimonadaceae bacterium]